MRVDWVRVNWVRVHWVRVGLGEVGAPWLVYHIRVEGSALPWVSLAGWGGWGQMDGCLSANLIPPIRFPSPTPTLRA